jgi:hypothetical protein
METEENIPNGTTREVDGKACVFYDGYWIKQYEPMEDSLETKKYLIEALTRRLFNHVEHGINMPGQRLDEARQAYEFEQDPELKRIKGAMLAGALFNRGTDIFRQLVDLGEQEGQSARSRELLHECGQYLLQALEMGKLVKHRSGEEGIDELWGEPFRAFTVPISSFYETRYIKIAQTMKAIDHISNAMVAAFRDSRFFPNAKILIREFADAAKLKSETLRTDSVIFEVWPKFVVASERLLAIGRVERTNESCGACWEADEGNRLLNEGTNLITHIARARVPMPKSTQSFIDRCNDYIKCRLQAAKFGGIELKSL